MEISPIFLVFVLLVSAASITFIAAIFLGFVADSNNEDSMFIRTIMFTLTVIYVLVILTVVYAFVTGIIRITV